MNSPMTQFQPLCTNETSKRGCKTRLLQTLMTTEQNVDCASDLLLTIEGEVAKDCSEKVHDKHAQNGHICDRLHASFGGTKGDHKRNNKKNKNKRKKR